MVLGIVRSCHRLCLLSNCIDEVGMPCDARSWFFVVLYADDILLILTSVSGLQKLLNICQGCLDSTRGNSAACVSDPSWEVCTISVCFEDNPSPWTRWECFVWCSPSHYGGSALVCQPCVVGVPQNTREKPTSVYNSKGSTLWISPIVTQKLGWVERGVRWNSLSLY